MHSYDTVSEALTDLKGRGYPYDFNLKEDCMFCEVLQRKYEPRQLAVKETYRFEGNTDPADEAVVYALCADDGVQGVFVNGYGTYADTESEAMLHLLGS